MLGNSIFDVDSVANHQGKIKCQEMMLGMLFIMGKKKEFSSLAHTQKSIPKWIKDLDVKDKNWKLHCKLQMAKRTLKRDKNVDKLDYVKSKKSKASIKKIWKHKPHTAMHIICKNYISERKR